MRRTDRLFEILQLFREGGLVRGKDLADRLEVSLRTVYRDIDTLIASGIPIEGERGVGYILREPIFLPPLALTPTELRALKLGVEILRRVSDDELAVAAGRVLAKVSAVSPSQDESDSAVTAMSVYAADVAADCPSLPLVRQAADQRQVIQIDYLSLAGQATRRDVWPLQTEFWGNCWTLAAWCELRRDFRAFRIDRIKDCRFTDRSFPDQEGRRYADYIKAVTNRSSEG